MGNTSIASSRAIIVISTVFLAMSVLGKRGDARPSHTRTAERIPDYIDYQAKLPEGAVMAVCRCWAKQSGSNPVVVDSDFLSERAARRLAAQGVPIDRSGQGNSAAHASAASPRIDSYTPVFSWSWPGHGTYLSYRQHHFAEDDEQMGWIEIKHAGGTWQARTLPQENIPIPIAIAICRTLIWKPTGGQKLHLYADPADKIAADLHAPFVDAKPYSAYRDLQWTEKAELGVDFGPITWIDAHTGFISFGTIHKPEKSDVSYALSHMELARLQNGRWTIHDIGVVPGGE